MREPEDYRESILPSDCKKRIAIEAGATQTWYRYIGLEGKVIGVNRFGLSAPGNTVMQEFGITKDNLLAQAQDLLNND